MIYYLVSNVYYNTNKDTYEKIVGFDTNVNDISLNPYIKPISIKSIEKVGLTPHSCFYVLMHPSEHRFLTLNDIDMVLNILLPLNYTINEVLTKIEIKRMRNIVYVINK